MNTQPQTRREFLQATARAILLAAVGLSGAVLLRRRRECTTRGGCDGCNLSDSCSLPWKVAKR
jgi:hypothetical protein